GRALKPGLHSALRAICGDLSLGFQAESWLRIHLFDENVRLKSHDIQLLLYDSLRDAKASAIPLSLSSAHSRKTLYGQAAQIPISICASAESMAGPVRGKMFSLPMVFRRPVDSRTSAG